MQCGRVDIREFRAIVVTLVTTTTVVNARMAACPRLITKGIGVMAVVGIRELKAQAAALVVRAEGGEPIVVSRHGKPVAVMLPLDMDVEEMLLANSSALAERRAKALVELERGEFIHVSELDEAIEEFRSQRLPTGDLSSAGDAALAE